MLDPESAALLQKIGNELVTIVVCTVTQTALFAVYSVLVIKTASILLKIRKGNSGRMGPLVTLAVVLLMYFMVFTLWIIDLVNTVGEIRITLVKDPDVALDIKYAQASDFVARRIAAIDAIYGYLTCIGDGVIIWRVYAFWASSHVRYIIIAFPIALLLASVACSIMLTYCVGRLGGNIVLGSFVDPEFCRKIQTVSYAIPAVTTAITTILIAIKLWTLIDFSGANGIFNARLSKTSRLWTIVIVLIETGVAYFLFFLAQAIPIAPSINDAIFARPGLAFAMEVFSYQTSSIVGMYPTIIICLVHAKRSAMDTALVSATLNEHKSKIPGHGRAPISLGSFRAVDPTRSTSTGGDLESQAEASNLGILHVRPPGHEDGKLEKH
ncbi:hypothetical protein L218DRAFT_936449 [Marasmius fiardii PR-910]|nr:hypothetical protein L218DRAFT_936449 [Marasmius fiardii PR-910]